MNNRKPEDFSLLIVDDDVNLLKIISMNLQMDGYRIFEAADGVEALKILDKNKIDFVISDVRMPNEDGISLLKKIRAKNPETPIVIMLSGYAELTKEEARKLGALDLLDKPVDIGILEDYIEQHRKTIQQER